MKSFSPQIGPKQATSKVVTVENCHIYWKNASAGNHPSNYLNKPSRSKYLLGLFKKYVVLSDKILDIGCNSGRNLEFLRKNGYQNLFGVDINKNAINILKSTFANLYNLAHIKCMAVESYLKKAKEDTFDVSYTMAVLMHIHPDSEQVFEEIYRVTKKYFICIENGVISGARTFARNYSKIFKNIGFTQVFEEDCTKKMEVSEGYVARVFKK